jgi:DNA repair protein RadD
MRVDYWIGFNRYQSEWICFEHKGYPRHRAQSWWRRRSKVPVPGNAAEAVELVQAGALCRTRAIKVHSSPGEKYGRIVGYELDDPPTRPDPPWSEDFVNEAHNDLADDDALPF